MLKLLDQLNCWQGNNSMQEIIQWRKPSRKCGTHLLFLEILAPQQRLKLDMRLTLFLVSLLVMSCAFCPPVFAFNEPSLTQLPPSLNSFCIECQNVFCHYFWACTVLPSHTTAAVDLVWPNLIHYDASWSQRSLMHCGQWGYQKFF